MMKRRTNNTKNTDDEWVDLIQAKTSDEPDGNQKHRTGKFNRRSAAVAIGVALVLLFTLSKSPRRWYAFFHHNSNRRNRKVVLLGPHDRYNDFGDILAERIITKLLVDRTGFVYNATDDATNTLLLGGIVTRDDMDQHGLTPKKTIYSMKTIQTMSRQDLQYGPYDIVFTGGSGEGPGDEGPSILYEKHPQAVEFLETEALQNSAAVDRVYDCPYLFPKELLLPKLNKTHGTNTRTHQHGIITTLPRPKKNFAIVDSLETPPLKDKARPGNLRGATNSKDAKTPPLTCRRVASHADHLGFRSSDPFVPDSTVMTKHVLGDEIDRIFDSQVKQDLLKFPEFSSSSAGKELRYVAVQHEMEQLKAFPHYAQELADALDEVSRKLGKIPVVFFPAGRLGRPVGDHLAFGLSKEVAQKMQQPSVVYETEHALEVAALISKASAVISTNLHVRILSFVYQKPRATWHGGANHQNFVDKWEAGDVGLLPIVSSASDTWNKGLQRFFNEDTGKALITQKQTQQASEKAIQYYLRNFHTWSSLLITPSGSNDDDDSY